MLMENLVKDLFFHKAFDQLDFHIFTRFSNIMD